MITNNRTHVSQRLPPFRGGRWSGASEFYGAGDVAADYCGIAQFLPVRGIWMHGWGPDYWHLGGTPDYIMANPTCLDSKTYCWVARKSEEKHLHSHGYNNGRAIGLPIVYLRELNVHRRPNSLLIMPAHSVEDTQHDWDERAYVEAIRSISHLFSHVAVCVHPVCLKKGYWGNTFEQCGFEIIEGSRADDLNALRRMQVLLSSFEYVTTNVLGSHVPYAAYFGAKVSIFGPYAEYKADHFAHDPFYSRQPDMLRHAINCASKKRVQHHYPELFCHPLDAKTRIDWAKRELGWDNRVSPAELRRLFGWGIGPQMLVKLREMIPEPVKKVVRFLKYRCGFSSRPK